MKLSAIGEFGFIRRISPPFVENLPDAVVGIGDDCAVIPWKDDASLLVTTDMLIEDIHFLRARIPPRDLGYKSLAINLSDIASMGGTPESAYISIGIPKDVEVEWLDEFYVGLRELAESERVHLLGGDTTKSPTHLVINIAVLGTVNPRLVKFRSTAKPGDVICLTDYIGDSGGGLKALLENKPMDDDGAYLVQRHHRPKAQLAEGAWLAAQDGVHAMMDVSDGIDSDLHRIMERSLCGAEVHIERLPISPQLQRTSERYGWDANELAVAGGEDYCLLTTVTPERHSIVAREFERRFNRPLANIGMITEKEKGLIYIEQGKLVEPRKHGFDHFA
jgi:thiamine-monophosphate kinase